MKRIRSSCVRDVTRSVIILLFMKRVDIPGYVWIFQGTRGLLQYFVIFLAFAIVNSIFLCRLLTSLITSLQLYLLYSCPFGVSISAFLTD